jgi:hypothetical protein
MPTRKENLDAIVQDTIKELEREVDKHKFMKDFDNKIPSNWINWRVGD